MYPQATDDTPHTHAHARTDTHARTRAHTHTHIHTYTHIHIHTTTRTNIDHSLTQKYKRWKLSRIKSGTYDGRKDGDKQRNRKKGINASNERGLFVHYGEFIQAYPLNAPAREGGRVWNRVSRIAWRDNDRIVKIKTFRRKGG